MWFPELRVDSNAEALAVVRTSARVVRLLFLRASRRPVMYDDWASADVASTETRATLVSMAVRRLRSGGEEKH